MQSLQRSSLDSERSLNSQFIKADLFKKMSKVKEMPQFSMPKATYHSYFGPKPNELPTLGPGAYEHTNHVRSGSSVSISPSRVGQRLAKSSTKSVLEANVGPGRYENNVSSFPTKKNSV